MRPSRAFWATPTVHISKLPSSLPAYLSHAGTEAKRDYQGLGKADRYVNHSGRNNMNT